MEQKKIVQRDYSKIGVPKIFLDVSLKSIQKVIAKENIKDFNIAIEYAKNIDKNVKNGYGLWFAGGVGTMKTSTAVSILKYYHDKTGYGKMICMCDLVNEIFAKNSNWADKETEYTNTNLLLVDDLGGEYNKTDWIVAKVDSIFSARYNKGLATIITTNLSFNELMKIYPARMIDRILSKCYLLTFAGASKRKMITVDMIVDYHNQTELNF